MNRFLFTRRVEAPTAPRHRRETTIVSPRSTRRPVTAVGVLIALVLGLMASISAASPASATTISRAYGYSYAGVYHGVFRQETHGSMHYVICTTPNAPLYSSQSFTYATGVSGASVTSNEEIRWLLVNLPLNESTTTGRNQRAAALYDAVNYFAYRDHKSSAGYVHWHHNFYTSSARNRALTTEYARWAEKYHGPYSFSVTLTSHPVVGNAGAGYVTMRPIWPGKHVYVTASNASFNTAHGYPYDTTYTATVNSAGHAWFRFVRTGTANPTFHYSVTNLAGGYLLLGHPTGGQQRLVAIGTRYTHTGSISYSRGQEVSTGSAACTTACNGSAPVTYHLTHSTYELGRDCLLKDDGVTVATVNLPRTSTTYTATVSHTMADRSKAQLFCRNHYLSGTLGAYYQTGPTLVVDCPPQLQLMYLANCNCTSETVVVQNATHVAIGQPIIFGAPIVNNTGHEAFVTVNGSTRYLAPGQSTPAYVYHPASGSTFTLTITTGTKYATKAGYHTWTKTATMQV